MKNKKIRLSANKGTILADLLEYTQQLIKKGDSSTAHKLQAIIQGNSVKSEIQPNKSSYVPLIIGGVLAVGLAVIVGYLVGKRRKEKEF